MKRGMGMEDFGELYELYFKDVYRYILAISNDSFIAEEITQDAFLKALKNIKSFKGRCSIRVWICQVAKNSYYTYLKRRKKLCDLDELDLSSNEDLSDEIIRHESLLEINREFNNLNEPYKDVFYLRIYMNLSFVEIGEAYEKSESWARVTYHRAKLKIKNKVLEGEK